MSEEASAVAGLKSNIQALISYCEQLKSEKNNLQQIIEGHASQLESKQDEISSRNEQITELEEKVKVLKMANSFSESTGESDTGAKLKINELVREIDKCIALLNR